MLEKTLPLINLLNIFHINDIIHIKLQINVNKLNLTINLILWNIIIITNHRKYINNLIIILQYKVLTVTLMFNRTYIDRLNKYKI